MNRDYFALLYGLFEDFSSGRPRTEDEICEALIRKTSSAIGCGAAAWFETDEARRTLTFRQSTGPVGADLPGVSFGYRGAAGWCAENRKAVIVNDTAADPRFAKEVDHATGFRTKNALAVPAIAGGKLLGVAEYVNSVDEAFSGRDLELASMIARLAARDIYIVRLEATVKQFSIKGESTINNLSGGFIGADLEGKIIFFNPKAREILEVGEEYLNREIGSISGRFPDIFNALSEVLKHGRTVRRQEFRCLINGRAKAIGYSSMNMKGVDGRLSGAGIIFQDITNL